MANHPGHPVEFLSAAVPDDMSRIIRIWTAGFPETRPEDIRAQVPQIIAAERSRLVVARSGLGQIASAMVVSIDPGRNKNRGHIEDVATHPDHLRQGFAAAVLDFSIDWFKQNNVQRVYLNSSDEKKAAHSLYFSRGFIIHETNSFQLDL